MKSISVPTILTLSFLAILLSGCQQRAASKLQGRWEGRPDSAARRTAREAEKYGDETVDKSAQADAVEGSSVEDAASDSIQVTDWEKYDVTIVMDFVSSEQVEMSLDGEQPVSGTWKVLSTTPSGCTIEVQSETGKAANGEATAERRRFELLLDEREGNCVGFQLTESGTDAQLGALYFQRPTNANSSSKAAANTN